MEMEFYETWSMNKTCLKWEYQYRYEHYIYLFIYFRSIKNNKNTSFPVA
jgi:hypothetical protein